VPEQQQPKAQFGKPEKQKFQLPHHRINARVRELMEAEEDSLTRGKRALVYLIKLVRETWRELHEKNCTLRASALAYKSLVSLVPLAAVILAVLSFQAFEGKRDQVLDKLLNTVLPVSAAPEGPENKDKEPAAASPGEGVSGTGEAAKTIEDKRAELKHIFTEEVNKLARRAAAVSITGLIALLAIVLSLMFTVEQTFNIIWGVQQGRPIVSRVVSYTAVLFWAPILVAASLSLSSVATQARTGPLGQVFSTVAWLKPIVVFFMPMVISTAALTALYVILPNTRVRFRPALAGAALAATLWELATLGFNLYVKYVVIRNPVYGALGLIPVTFLWFYYTWLVVLFGASVSFTVQNYVDLTRKEERRRRGVRFRVYYAMRTAAAVAARFSRGEPTTVIEELAERLDIPEYSVRESLDGLARKGLLVPVAGELDAYVPARPLENITVADVLEAVSGETFHLPGLTADPTHARLQALLSGVESEIHGRLGATTLRDLAADEQASRASWLESHGAAPA